MTIAEQHHVQLQEAVSRKDWDAYRDRLESMGNQSVRVEHMYGMSTYVFEDDSVLWADIERYESKGSLVPDTINPEFPYYLLKADTPYMFPPRD